ncbi:Hsp70 family protein, partial [Actinoplanes sp. NPDC024001]
ASARAVAAAPPQQRPEAARPKRGRGRFMRAMQILLSVLTMIVVPLVALVFAYGYANGKPLDQDAVAVFEDLAELLGWR